MHSFEPLSSGFSHALFSSVTSVATSVEQRRLLSSDSVGAIMFIELCKQRAGDFMLELLKPLFNTILR